MSILIETTKKPFWAMSPDETFASLETGQNGLDETEASRRSLVFGPNTIEEKISATKLKIVFNQIKSPLILTLIAAGFITWFLGEYTETYVIFAAVFVNTILGFYQENKAETALRLLKSYISIRSRVRRAGREFEIDASRLIPGDIIRVSQGDRVPADARLIFTSNFETDESMLTGESLGVQKDLSPIAAGTAVGDRKSMIFLGTLAVQGFADAVVTSIGKDTEVGKIAKFIGEEKKEETPLQRAISDFSKKTGLLIIGFVGILFGLGVFSGYGIFEMFLIAVSVAVSAVPEGLPIAMTVVLSIGVERLASRKSIIRRLLAAETLGSTSLILTDKTGTLTEAKMKLSKILPHGEGFGDLPLKKLLELALLNTDVVIENKNDDPSLWKMFGRPLEVALIKGAAEKGVLFTEVEKNYKNLDWLPFDSKNKFSATVSSSSSGENIIALLGAPDIILEYTKLGDDDKKFILEELEKMAIQGERVVGVASGVMGLNHKDILHNQKFENLSFNGLISFRDPLRPHVTDAIRRIWAAGVKTVIVTGDHKGTAEAVARELGMIDGKGAVLTGDDLNYLKKDEILARSEDITVYARVTPEQKLMLVRMYQEKGEVVAVTGDGVNDAPALDKADIGIALGSGTDVAKSAADVVILDDDYGTIVTAIEEGRKIFDNMRKVIVYLLSDSLDELFLIGGALLFGMSLPINALQILFVNFFSDSFPAIALAFEKGIDGLGVKPRKLNRNFFDKEMRFLILVIGVLTSALLFIIYYFLIKFGFAEEIVKTFIFASFAIYTLFLSFSIRSLEKSILSYNPFSNFYLLAGVSIGVFLTALVVYVPFLQTVFGTVFLSSAWVAGVVAICLINISAVEFGKWLFRQGILK